MGGILCVHCENGTLVNELQKRVFEQGIHGPEGHALSRPDVCEAEAVSRLLYLAHLAGDAPVNVVHLRPSWGSRPSVPPRRAGRRISMSRPALSI